MEEDTVILQVGENEYECSKSQLSNLSEYFRIMFTGNFAEKKMSKIKLKDVSVTSWEYIYNFLKYGYISSDTKKIGFLSDILELMETANMLQFKYIEESCASIINDSLTISNCLQIFDIVNRLEYRPLTAAINSFLLFYFDDIIKSDEFCNLSIDQIERYCSGSGLYSRDGELGIWKALVKWMNFSSDSNSRLEYTSRLIKCLHLGSLSFNDLQTLVLCDCIKRFPLVLNVIQKKIKIFQDSLQSEFRDNEKDGIVKESDNEVTQFLNDWLKTKPRVPPICPCIVGSVFEKSTNNTFPFILKFSENEKTIIPLIKLENMETCLGTMVGFKVISDGFKMFLVGGIVMKREREWNKAIWIYDRVLGCWSFFSGLSRPIRHMSVCLLHNNLYIIGGIGRHRVTQTLVSRLSLADKVWSECAPLPHPMYAAPCVVFQNSIYLISSNIYRYDVESNSWLIINYTSLNVSEVGTFCSAVANDHYIYVLGNSSNKIFKLDPNLLPVQLTLVGSFDHEYASQICLVGNYIYLFSQDDSTEIIFCKKMNIVNGEVQNIFETKPDSTIASIDTRHQQGCFWVYT